MEKFFLRLTLLCLSLSARAHNAEVNGIFYNLDAANKTATVTFKGNYYDSYDNEYSGDVVIPETVTYHGITYSVTSVRESCFRDCSSLTSITIPNSVTSLGDYCFWNCSSLASITIPNSVTSLGDYCFWDCSSLTSITLGNSVTSLGLLCFYDCSSLERIVVDAANPVYDSREDCNAIIHTSTNELIVGCKNSQIPNSVTSLGEECFSGCSSLTSITIPNSVTSLGEACFAGCSSLTSIYMLPSTPPSTEWNLFYDTPLRSVYVVDEDAKTAYQAQVPWSEYEIVVMPTGIDEVETDKTAPTIVGYYDLNGKLINGKQRGAVIVRYSDGTTRKVLK